MATIHHYDVLLNEGAHRFEIRLDEHRAFMEIGRQEGILVLLHTEVPLFFRGKGAGAALVYHAMEYARSNNLKVVALCPYSQAWLKKHTEYSDLLLPLDALRD